MPKPMRSWKKMLKKMCMGLACNVMGRKSRQRAPEAIDGPQEAPKRYKEQSLGVPPMLPSSNEPRYSAICKTEMRHTKVSVSKLGNRRSRRPSFLATARFLAAASSSSLRSRAAASCGKGGGGSSGGTMDIFSSVAAPAAAAALEAPAPAAAAPAPANAAAAMEAAAAMAPTRPTSATATPRQATTGVEQVSRKAPRAAALARRRGGAWGMKTKCSKASFDRHIAGRGLHPSNR
mmetsp:Transcript_122282/g.260942  ORF Transcript_122282/g.260942 Transcript_122282/m.260942 type:complete len:234 (-) Transcript_122282:83-784(-)